MADSTVVNLERRGTRTRGGQTRQKILDATLRVIAREGVRGTTHRAIASEADVQLSLTTYYFKDLNEMETMAPWPSSGKRRSSTWISFRPTTSPIVSRAVALSITVQNALSTMCGMG
jgi:DNA-binding transcriptional regulator YbjK